MPVPRKALLQRVDAAIRSNLAPTIADLLADVRAFLASSKTTVAEAGKMGGCQSPHNLRLCQTG